jgi:hypothetical protein
MLCSRRTGRRGTEWTVRSCSVGGSDAACSPEHETVTGTLLLAHDEAQACASSRAALGPRPGRASRRHACFVGGGAVMRTATGRGAWAPPRNGSRAFGRAAAPALREGPLWRNSSTSRLDWVALREAVEDYPPALRARARDGCALVFASTDRRGMATWRLATRGPSTSRMMAVDVAGLSAWRCVADRRVRRVRARGSSAR